VVHGYNTYDASTAYAGDLAFIDDDDLTEASAMSPTVGAAGPSGSSNSLDHFVDAIATKIITKGGAATSRFLYDSAAIGLRELVTATKPTKVLAAAEPAGRECPPQSA
jgi:hypothetical protein